MASDYLVAACNVVDSVASPLAHAYHEAAYLVAAASPADPSFLRAAVPLIPDAFVVPVFASKAACAVDPAARTGAANALHGAPHNSVLLASH